VASFEIASLLPHPEPRTGDGRLINSIGINESVSFAKDLCAIFARLRVPQPDQLQQSTKTGLAVRGLSRVRLRIGATFFALTQEADQSYIFFLIETYRFLYMLDRDFDPDRSSSATASRAATSGIAIPVRMQAHTRRGHLAFGNVNRLFTM